MHRRPHSAYATEGVRAFGSHGVVPATDKRFPGLNIAEYVRLRDGSNLQPPCFARVHFTKPGSGEPGEGVFLVWAALHKPTNPAACLVFGSWTVTQSGPSATINTCFLAERLKKEPSNRLTLEAMASGEQIVTLDWLDQIKLSDMQLSTVVLRSMGQLTDAHRGVRPGLPAPIAPLPE